jgi:biotin/methionine sulfoxide reductase
MAAGGQISGAGRGREPFVPVEWAEALDLVAGELARVRREGGPAPIMGGSQGWSSAGHFHEARGQLRRFLTASGGFVDQTSNYSFGTARTFLPHILGSAQAVTGPLTSWPSIARHTRLFVLFGGANPKNTQVAKGGCAWHGTSGAFAGLAQAGVRVVNISPIREDGPQAVSPEMDPDPAEYRHGDDAGAKQFGAGLRYVLAKRLDRNSTANARIRLVRRVPRRSRR